jgi:cell division protein FtsQ
MMTKRPTQDKRAHRQGATATVRQSSRDVRARGLVSRLFKRTLFVAVFCSVVAGIGGAVFWGKHLVGQMTQRPINSIGVEGQFAYISQQIISDLVTPMIVGGFLQSPLSAIKAELERNPWIAQAAVSRRWPDQLFISIVEEQPIARWGNKGFLNHKGEIVAVPVNPHLQHLPLLVGNAGQEKAVMQNYQELARMLLPYGLKIGKFQSDELFSWHVVLTDGLKITIGRDQIMEKIQRFLVVYNRELHKRLDKAAAVDLRYGNGLAVRWKTAAANSPFGRNG